MNNLEQNLHDYKSSDGLLISIKALCNNFFQDTANKDINALPEILKAKMNELYDKMNKEDLINAKNLKSAMEGINQAIVGTEDELNRAIEAKREEIKNRLKISFEAAEEVVKDRNFSEKEEILELLNNAIIRETRLLGILKESAQIAFLTTLEGAKDVEETAGAIAKNMTYVAITGGEFSKERILEISKNIIIAAANLADEGHIFAKELISGAISGTRDGILRAIEKLKDEAKFAPDELRLNSQLLNLKNIDEEFIALLRELEKEFEGVARNEIENVINSELDTNLAKFKRISDQAREQIISRIEELKSNGMVKLMSEANNKFEALKQELNDKSKKLKLNFDTNDKIEEIKQEIANLEKKANEKFEDIKQIDIKSEAKKFGDRAYQAAKDLLNVIKKDKKED